MTAAPLARPQRTLRERLRKVSWPQHLVLIVLLALTFYPVVLMLLFSVKNNTQFVVQRYELSLPLHLDNFPRAWNAGIWRYMLNSIIYVVGGVLLTMVPAVLSAYAFARIRFIGKNLLFYLVISLIMIPWILILLPAFYLVIDLDMLSTRQAFWLSYGSWGLAFAIFVLRTFFAGLPEDLFESARVDGAREIHILWAIVLPLSKPIVGTLALLQTISIWNDIIWATTINTNPDLKPIMVGLMAFTGLYRSQYGPLNAGYVISSIPMLLLFAFTSRLFIRGLMSGAIRM